MDNSIFKEFKIASKADINIIEKYKDLIPLQLKSAWENYGFGTILNGYLKIVNPDEYQSIINMSYFRANVSKPILITAFGDIITWEENKYIGIIRYNKGNFNIISSGFKYFFSDLLDEYFVGKHLQVDKYIQAIEKYGELEYDECFGYVPLLGLGGSEKVENLRKVKIREHIELITQLVGKIE